MMGHVALSPPPFACRSGVLHRGLGAAGRTLAGRSGRSLARRGAGDTGGTAVRDRGIPGAAGPSALHLAAARGLRLLGAVGRNQGAVYTGGEGQGAMEPHPTVTVEMWSRAMPGSGSGGSTIITSGMSAILWRMSGIIGGTQ